MPCKFSKEHTIVYLVPNLFQFVLQLLPYTLHQGSLTLCWDERTETHGVRTIQTSIKQIGVTINLVIFIIIGHCCPHAFSGRNTCSGSMLKAEFALVFHGFTKHRV